MILFPHEPFCEAALYSFSTNPMKDVICKYLMQVFDAFIVFAIVLIIDNWVLVYKTIKYTCFKSKDQN